MSGWLCVFFFTARTAVLDRVLPCCYAHTALVALERHSDGDADGGGAGAGAGASAGGANRVFLTLVGGGVFGNMPHWIIGVGEL